jgi:drug/metabolite transporter (DMT)-like permease
MEMKNTKLYPVFMALMAACLFGASAPLTKMLLGKIEPVPLAAFLYLGSGLGLLVFQGLMRFMKKHRIREAPIKSKDIPWLAGAILFGGVIAPILLLVSLNKTPASTAALLLNFEGVATTVIAIIVFKENAGKEIIGAVILITLASIILSWDFSNEWGLSLSALGIVCACICWGIDNNFTRNISAKNPFSIVIIKGIIAGSVSLIISVLFQYQLPKFDVIIISMVIGFFCYGSSIVLFVFALRSLGSARTSALFGASPFIGVILSFILLGDKLSSMFIISLPLMIIGTILLLREKHSHVHRHEPMQHEHSHSHDDGHHNHSHEGAEAANKGKHTHYHVHEATEHEHPHAPDVEHRHVH